MNSKKNIPVVKHVAEKVSFEAQSTEHDKEDGKTTSRNKNNKLTYPIVLQFKPIMGIMTFVSSENASFHLNIF